jgi:Raf kinase inhibitor-like YbhB/YbcL family protein
MKNTLYKLKDKSVLKISFLSILTLFLLCNLIVLEFNACSPAYSASNERNRMSSKFALFSSDFKSGQAIPKRCTADGSNVSPELFWTDIPAGTKSLALICEDPDAPSGTWIHWIVYDIPANKISLRRAITPEATLKDQTKQGINSFRHVGYGGPSPPPGPAHRYFFRLYALNEVFGYESAMTLYKFRDFVLRHKIAEAETMGTYGR